MGARGTQSPLDSNPGTRDKERDQEVVLTVSLRNINQLTVTRLKGQPTGGDIRQYVVFNCTGTRHRAEEYRCTTVEPS